jgi:hypothetical protein
VIETVSKGTPHSGGSGVRPSDIATHHDRCTYPRYDKKGRKVIAVPQDALPSPQVNGWIEAAFQTSAPIDGMLGSFYVPNYPTNGGALIYLFPALEDEAVTHILQPVLAYWNGSYTIAGWHVDSSNNAEHSTPVVVNPGDSLIATVGGHNCFPQSAGVCSNWSIGLYDQNTETDSSLGITNSVQYTIAFGGALEAWGLDNCAQLPAGTGERFHTIFSRFDANWQQPFWSGGVFDVSPICSYGVSSDPNRAGDAILSWSN